MAQVGVVLSGCGFLDGSEIHEAVLTLLALQKSGASYQCLAPDIDQMHVVDHVAGEPAAGETRNVLKEAARIARGDIKALGDVSAKDFDALVFPGGYGAAKNLSNFATEGTSSEVEPSVAQFVQEVHSAGKPIGFICISPAIAARLLPGVKLTIGSDPGTAAALEEMGAEHIECPANDFVEDSEQRVLSTPAYMCDAPLPEIAEGIEKLVKRLSALAG
ncbi:MAG: isoprenoid biosynthesis protein ElbB [Acidobacteria bacterium]|nr:MAG: isoprenoid biosynthesis protein ElbB [Acidobacteriota bacterium]